MHWGKGANGGECGKGAWDCATCGGERNSMLGIGVILLLFVKNED